MSRRKFSEKDVLRTLLHQGVEIRDFRTGELITLENVNQVEREHLVELGLAKTDVEKRKFDQPKYCRYSLKTSHDIVTNGSGATTAGSSKGRVSKAKRIERTGKMAVIKLLPGDSATAGRKRPKRPIPSRPLQSRSQWPAKGSRPFRRART